MPDGTGHIELKYLIEDVDRHGNVRLYLRRHGRKIRLHEPPGSQAFMAAYRAALAELESAGEDAAAGWSLSLIHI